MVRVITAYDDLMQPRSWGTIRLACFILRLRFIKKIKKIKKINIYIYIYHNAGDIECKYTAILHAATTDCTAVVSVR